MTDTEGDSGQALSQDDDQRAPLAYVGVGGSAGSLRAFQSLLDSVPADSGLTYILIPHLAPDRDSMLVSLLNKHTRIPVVQVDRPLRALANHVYVIAPNKDLGIRDGTLQPRKASNPQGVRTTIYRFFSELAQDQGKRAVGIILSGTGSDGSDGIKEIKANGGLTLAQSPETADYDSMPRSALNTGMVDHVLPTEDMAALLGRFVRHPYVSANASPAAAELDTEAEDSEAKNGTLGQILDLVWKRTGRDFHHYKTGTLIRRINRRIGVRQVSSLKDYRTLLSQDEGEIDQLFRDLLIGVTQFFREPDAFKTLESECLAPLVARATEHAETVRVWVPGCASGEEAYSIAIGLLEAADAAPRPPRVEVFATDIDTAALDRARAGRYPESVAEHVPPARLKRWFNREEDGYQVIPALRDCVVFAPQNLIADPPFSRMDLIACRNLLIYLDKSVQPRLLRLFHFALRPGGHLFLGNSESIGDDEGLFATVSRHARLYRRVERDDGNGQRLDWIAPSARSAGPPPEPVTEEAADWSAGDKRLVSATHRILLRDFAPTSVVVNERFEVLYLHGNLDPYLSLPDGTPSSNLLELARRGLRGRLQDLVERVLGESRTFAREEMRVLRNRHYHPVEVTARSFLAAGQQKRCVLLCLHETEGSTTAPQPAPADYNEEELVAQLEYELRVSQDELQGTIEQLEAANEELKTANEESLSINEELQSSNEELESSKEELQSLNEELNVVNSELQEKVDQVESANTDLVNLLDSTEIATVFLDADCYIRRFTPAAPRLFSLIPSDIGRPIGDISHQFMDTFDVAGDAATVQRTGAPIESEARTQDDTWYLRRMTPYRTQNGSIDGVVLAFLNITTLKQTHFRLERSEARFRALYEDNPSMYLSLDSDGGIQSINRFGAAQLGFEPGELVGRSLVELTTTPEALETLLQQCRGESDVSQRGELCLLCHGGQSIWVRAHARPVRDSNDALATLVACEDITKEKQLSDEAQYHANHDPLTGLINRRAFERILEHTITSARSRAHQHTVCYLDLDSFKLVNDTHGHEAGDELLRQITDRMRGCLRQRDVLARLGGDEFAVLMEHCELPDARKIAEAIIASVRDFEFMWHGHRLRVGCCAGLAPVDRHTESLREILRAADAACFEAKAVGSNTARLHTDHDGRSTHRRHQMSWTNRLRSALEKNRLQLYAQPVVGLQHDGEVYAYEALMRLQDDDGPVIEAKDFMAAATRYGLGRDIDRLALTQSLDFLAANAERLRPFHWLSINLSASSMDYPDFLDFALAAVREADVDPSKLCFEITETTVISSLTRAEEFMNALKALGCSFALDDFGTGLSSFQYLRLLPADHIKIDGSFIRNLPSDEADRAVVEAVHYVAQLMGKTTVAECVESEATHRAVRAMGIEYGQGYYYGAPAPIAEMLLVEGAEDAHASCD